MNTCIVCLSESETLCQRCRTAYCSRKCQADDWPTHKLICIPMPLLVAAKKPQVEKPKSLVNEPIVVSLRPPKKKLLSPSVIASSANVESRKSLFDNSFKDEASSVKIATEIKKTETAMPLPRMLSKTILVKPQSIDDPSIVFENLSVNIAKKEAEEVVEKVTKPSILTMKDIEIVPLPPGKKLVCTDSSNIAKGYISSCINDKKAIELIDRLSVKINEYCEKTNDSYSPTIDELCLCIFDEDKLWYRAVVSKVINSDQWEVTFIDFGNEAIVSSECIRKMSREFTHHCLVNKCYVKGLLNEPTSEADIANMKLFFDNNPIFDVLSLDDKHSFYIINPKLCV